MLRQLLGPQGASAVILAGEPLDGREAARRGLAWKAVEDGKLLDEAIRMAANTTVAPREMVRRLKTTIRDMAAVTDHLEAVERELEPQLWSVDQPVFKERLAALKRRISERKR